jgi:tagatose-1,6-bisphosphate aldolase non-catalytic subunit AgaZ/GatZ
MAEEIREGETMSENRPQYGKPNLLYPLREAIDALETAEESLFRLWRASNIDQKVNTLSRHSIYEMYEQAGNNATRLRRLLEIQEAATLNALKSD